MAAFHLHHRVSVDLDLFTLDDLALREGEVLVPQLTSDLKCHIARARRTEHYCEFLLEPGEGEALKVDLVRDVGPRYGEHIKVGTVIVDSVENIGANKLPAILGCTEPKDFVDLYFSYSFTVPQLNSRAHNSWTLVVWRFRSSRNCATSLP